MAANEKKERFQPLKSEAKRCDPPAQSADVLQWLAVQDAGLRWLLATTHGAVVWGRRDDDGWLLSNGSQALPGESLLDLRAFGESAEVFVWRDASGLRARRRVDGQGDQLDTLEETQLLWGTARDTTTVAPGGFTPLYDGDQGLRHAPPLVLDDSYFIPSEKPGEKKDPRYGHRPARLRLRHYIGQDKDTGVARIVDSRLVALEQEKPLPKTKVEVKENVAKA